MAISDTLEPAAGDHKLVNGLIAAIALNGSIRTPLHVQLREAIREIISSSSAEGAVLIPERTLAEKVGVSRITVNRALDDLRREGWLIRKAGQGTMVPPRPLRGTVALPQSASRHSLREIGLITYSCNSEFMSALINELMDECAARKIVLRLHRVNWAVATFYRSHGQQSRP